MMDETQAYSPEPLPSFRSSATDAFKAIIETPNWVGNLLWLTIAGVASSIFVGQIAAFGYGAELLRRRAGRPDMPNHDIDSDRLGDYLSQGIGRSSSHWSSSSALQRFWHYPLAYSLS